MDMKSLFSPKKKNLAVALAVASALTASGVALAAVPHALDITSISSSTASDSAAADGVSLTVTAGTPVSITVTAMDVSGATDTTADGSVTLTLKGKYTGAIASMTATLTSGVATFSLPSVTTADTYWVTANYVGASVSSASPAHMDSLVVSASTAAGIKMSSQKAAIGSSNVAGAGSMVTVMPVDAYGNATTAGSSRAVSVSGNLISAFATTITAGSSSISFEVGGTGTPVSGTGTLNLMAEAAFGTSGTTSSTVDIAVESNNLVASPSAFTSPMTAGVTLADAFSVAAADGSAVSAVSIAHKAKMLSETITSAVDANAADATFYTATPAGTSGEYYVFTATGLGDAVVNDVVPSAADVAPAAPASVALMANGMALTSLAAMNGSVSIPGSALVAMDAFGNPTSAVVSLTSITSGDAGATVSGTPLSVGSAGSASVSYASAFTTDSISLNFDGSLPALSLTIRGQAPALISYPELTKGTYDMEYDLVGTPDATMKGGAALGAGEHMTSLSIPAGDSSIVHIGGVIDIPAADVGKTGRIVAAFVYDSDPIEQYGPVYYFSMDGQGDFDSWNADWSQLPAIGGTRTLTASESVGVNLFNAPLGIYGLPGLAHIYFGYITDDDQTVVKAGGPIAIVFE